MTENMPKQWSGLLIVRDRRVLMLKEEDKDFWLLPGGKQEPGESPKETALREVDEELGVEAKIESDEPLLVIETNSASTGEAFRYILFEGLLVGLIDIMSLPGKTTAVGWFNSLDVENGLPVGGLLTKALPKLVEMDIVD